MPRLVWCTFVADTDVLLQRFLPRYVLDVNN